MVSTGSTDEVANAVALIGRSALFDAGWYAERTGRVFPDRTAAITDYVTTRGRDATPHPLFADRWLYPGGRWRTRSPDPLSDYLGEAGRRRRSPHPLIDVATLLAALPSAADGPLGPVDAWLRSTGPITPLPTKLGSITYGDAVDAMRSPSMVERSRDHVAGPLVLLLPPDQPDAAVMTVAWQRWLHRRGLPTLVVAHDPEVRPVVASVAASLDRSAVSDSLPALAEAEVVVVLRLTRRPTTWTDLTPLVRALDEQTVSLAQAVIVDDDRTIAAAGATWPDTTARPFLAGLPLADAARAASAPLAGPWPGAVAVRGRDLASTGSTDVAGEVDELALAAGLSGSIVLVPGALVPGVALPVEAHARRDDLDRAAWRAAGFEAPGRSLSVVEGRPALRWAIDTAGPFRDAKWGDLHFASALADALTGLGQYVAVDHPETRGRASRDLDDVVLVLRGLERVVTTPLDPRGTGAVSLLWVISHPDDVDAAEVASYDATWAAGPAWAEKSSAAWGLPIGTLLQAADPERFHPGLAEPDSGPDLLFVGNRRRGQRPAVLDSVAAGLRPTVYGAGWDGIVDVVADHVDNAGLGALYASAGIVLNDHWPDMAAAGFVSNRVFDVLATGARLLTDRVAGLDRLFPEVPVFTGPGDLAAIVGDRDAYFPDPAARLALAERVVVEHSFAARAAVLLEEALRLRSP